MLKREAALRHEIFWLNQTKIFLGMELGFSEDGVCHVRQDIHVNDLIDSLLKSLKLPTKYQLLGL